MIDRPADAARTNVMLVDDHPIVRQGLAQIIAGESDLHVCGQADSIDTALATAADCRPALALVDLMLHGQSSLDLIRRLRSRQPTLRVVVLSMHDETVWAVKALRAGACGYVMKHEPAPVIIGRVRQALRGETAVSEIVAAAALRQLTWGQDAPAEDDDAESKLGDRERQVLALLGEGKSSRAIAAALHISVKTVDAHREHIKRKLGLKSAGELIRHAVLRAERDASG